MVFGIEGRVVKISVILTFKCCLCGIYDLCGSSELALVSGESMKVWVGNPKNITKIL